jgi:hypothetical protein
MTNLRTNQDIIRYSLRRANEKDDGTSDFHADAIVHYNRILQAICAGGSELAPNVDEDWWWLRAPSPGVIQMRKAWVGTADVTKGSTVVTAGTYPNYAFDDSFSIRFDSDDPTVYRISNGIGGAITLDQAYIGASVAGTAYRAWQREYTLAPDLDQVLGPMRAFVADADPIEGTSVEEMDRQWPFSRLTQGVPTRYAMTGEQRARFNSAWDETSTDTAGQEYLRIEYDYKVIATEQAFDSSEPIVPYQYRRILADFLTSFIMGDKNDTRAVTIAQMGIMGLQGMQTEQRNRMAKQGRAMGQIVPRQDQVGRRRLWDRVA